MLFKTIQHKMRLFSFDLKCSFSNSILLNGCVMSQVINEPWFIFLSSVGARQRAWVREV